ncbi:tetratricopeptide repeat protein [candidate division WOR-3 bacterium]|nr:tetratricopeptide repeat protein [candidate division WOR-3 bacterium]
MPVRIDRSLAVILLLCVAWISVAPADNIDHFERANELLEAGNYPAAITTYETFIKENPDSDLVPAAKWAIANIHFVVEKDYRKAALLYQNIIGKHTDTGWEILSYERLGACYEQEQRWIDAARLYESAIERLAAPSHAEAAADWYDGFKERLLSCYRMLNDLPGMVRVYDESLEKSPLVSSAPGDLFGLAEVFLEMNDPATAASHFAAVVDRYPFSAHARRVRDEHGKLLAAQVSYDWVPFATFQTCLTLSESGRYEEASVGFDTVIARKEGTGMEHAARFQKELIRFRQTGDAASFRDRLMKSREEHPYGFGGVSEDELYDILETVIKAQETAASNPGEFTPYARMAYAYYQIRAYSPAIENYERAIEFAPNNSDLYVMLGYCYMGVGAYDDAIRVFGKSIETAPWDPNSYDSMAEAYYTRGDTAMAVEFYEKSLSVDPTFVNPYYVLGEINMHAGHKDKAVHYLSRYLELAPEGSRAGEARALLDGLTDEY